MLVQIGARLTGLTVIATALPPESKQWCLDLGAHHVIDHTQTFADQLQSIEIPEVELQNL